MCITVKMKKAVEVSWKHISRGCAAVWTKKSRKSAGTGTEFIVGIVFGKVALVVCRTRNGSRSGSSF